MAPHIVKCLYCGERFDALPQEQDIVWMKPRSNRYAHVKCAKEKESSKTQEEKDFEDLYNYVKTEQGANFNFVQFKKIIESWKKEYSYTYSGILKSLLYFYEVKGNSKEKFRSGSIGIVPFCYTQAYNYYYELYMASQRAAGSSNYNNNISTIINIDSPIPKVAPPKLFNMDMED